MKDDKGYEERIESLTKENKELQDRNKILENKNNELEIELEKLQWNIKNLSNKTEWQKNELISALNEETFKKSNLILPVYRANIDTYEREIDFYKILPKNISLKEQLQAIGNSLSEYYYNNSPIEVLKIENIDNKKIATIDLREDKGNEVGWANMFFQGSAGGTITSTTLTETFLQRDYDDECIDGVKFLYEGKDVEFEHVFNLQEIIYR